MLNRLNRQLLISDHIDVLRSSVFNKRAFAYISFLLVMRYIQVAAVFNEHMIGIAYSLSVGIITLTEIYYASKRYALFLFHPTVICSILLFLMGFCVSNYVYYIGHNEGIISFAEGVVGDDTYKYINEGMFWANIALVSLWFGFYRTDISNKLYNTITPPKLLKIIRKEMNFNMPVVNVIYVISIIARLFLITFGIFGFASTVANGGGYEKMMGILTILVSGSSLGLFAYSIRYFNKKGGITIVILTCILEIFFGILSGFKSGLVYPVVIIFLAYIVVNKKLNFRAVAIFAVCGVFLTILAFSIIENFRKRVIDASAGDVTGVDSLVTFTLDQDVNLSDGSYDNMSTWESTLVRMNFSVYNGIAFKNIGTKAGSDYAASTRTTEKIIFSFIYSIVPRALWSNKPVRENGSLFYMYFMGGNVSTSISPSTVGYIGIIYGPLFIIPVFILIGIMQNVAFSFSRIGLGGLIITFILLAPLANIDEFDFLLINTFRNFFVALIVQYFLLKK